MAILISLTIKIILKIFDDEWLSIRHFSYFICGITELLIEALLYSAITH